MQSAYEDLMEIIRTRRSIRAFQKRPVERELIYKIIEAGRWAPSACNKQAWKFLVIDNAEIKKELAERIRTKASKRLMQETPVLVYVLYNKYVNPEKHANVQSASAAIQNMLLSAHSLKLGACWFSHFFDDLVRERFQIPDEYAIIATILLGYPGKTPPPPKRFAVEEILYFNGFPEIDGGLLSPDPEKWSVNDIAGVVSRHIFSTSPEIGFVYPRPKELESILSILWAKVFPDESVLFLFPTPGEVMFQWLQGNQHHVDCLDISPEAKDWMRRRQVGLGIAESRVRYLLTSDLSFPMENRSYDKVILFETLNRFSCLKRRRILGEVKRVLSERGKAIIFYANRWSYRGIPLWRQKFRYLMHFGPFVFLSEKEMSRMINECGFRVEESGGIDLLPENASVQGALRVLLKAFPFSLEGWHTMGSLRRFMRILYHECVKG